MNINVLHLSLTPAAFMLFALVLTMGAYFFASYLHRKVHHPLANPVLIAILIVCGVLYLLHLPYETYFSGAQAIHFMLGPATVALAIPMVRSLEHMKRGFVGMVLALLAGSVVGMVAGYGLVRLFGGSQMVALSMLPKSLTTPIAIGVSQSVGGQPSVTVAFAIVAGVLVAVSVDAALAMMKIAEPAARGLAAGTAGSGLGASRVIPQHPVAAAFAGVAIGANGFLTAVLAPVVVPLLKHW